MGEYIAQKCIEKIERCIDIAMDQERYLLDNNYRRRTKLNNAILSTFGMSTSEVRIFLNEIVDSETNYLEIGIHRGSTFVSAMYKNKPKSTFAIDNFGGSLFSGNIKKVFLTNCMIHNVRVNEDFVLFHEDSFKLKKEQKDLIKDINVYFYDGGHSADDHRKALTYFYENLSDTFILIVDDWVHPPAVEGTMLGIKEKNLSIIREWKMGFSQHLKDDNPNKLSWHNGLYIAVIEKNAN